VKPGGIGFAVYLALPASYCGGQAGAAISTALEPLAMLTLPGIVLYRAGAVVVRLAIRRRRRPQGS
jgi:hypothetical protein